MASSVNYIESGELNRFTLSLKDPVLESAFLDEYGKNALRVTLTYFPFILLIFAIGLGVIMALVPHLTFLRNMMICGLGFLALSFIYFRLLPPGVNYMQLVFSAIGILLGWFYAYRKHWDVVSLLHNSLPKHPLLLLFISPKSILVARFQQSSLIPNPFLLASLPG